MDSRPEGKTYTVDVTLTKDLQCEVSEVFLVTITDTSSLFTYVIGRDFLEGGDINNLRNILLKLRDGDSLNISS